MFLVGAAALVRAGVALAGAGDELADRSGLGGRFVGTLFLAGATSLPEAVTDISAAAAGSPDLAVGDLFGSSMANMAVLAVIDISYRGRVWLAVEVGHARVAAVAIGLTSLATLSVLTPPGLSIGWVGVDTLGVAVAYVAAVAWFRRSPQVTRAAGAEPTSGLLVPTGWKSSSGRRPETGVAAPIIGLAAAAGVILVSAPMVAVAALEVTRDVGVAETTVGAGLLAVTTSLPELVAALAAVRIGAHDLAVGNLFGSNTANMAVLLLADAAFTEGPILPVASSAQAVAAVGAVFLMALALAAIVGGTETRIGRMEPDAALLLLAYVGVLVAVGAAA